MIKIEIEKNTRQVYLNNGYIGNDKENLQDTLEFSFKDEFVDGQARLELQFENKEKTFIVLDKTEETYTTPITNIMTQKGQVYAQLVITEGTEEESIPIFKSNIFYFYVGESINAETGDEEPYIEWIDKANTKLNQIDNLNIEAEKVDKTTTITITRKDGTTQEVEVLDGEKGDKGQTGETGQAGKGIANISKTSTSGLVDTYTIEYTDGTTSTFNVTNGEVTKAYLDSLVGDINSILATLTNVEEGE